MNHRPFIFIDLETTGVSPRYNRILEIGAIRVENLQEVGRYSTLLNVSEEISPTITKLTGIDNAMIRDSPNFIDIADTLRDFIGEGIFVAHNVSFDYGFMQSEYRKLGQKFSMDKLCTVRLSKAFYPEQSRHNLDTIINTHGFIVQNRHHALDDAQVLVEFFNKIISQNQLQSFAILDKLVRHAHL